MQNTNDDDRDVLRVATPNADDERMDPGDLAMMAKVKAAVLEKEREVVRIGRFLVLGVVGSDLRGRGPKARSQGRHQAAPWRGHEAAARAHASRGADARPARARQRGAGL
jgi:hypothetical protein